MLSQCFHVNPRGPMNKANWNKAIEFAKTIADIPDEDLLVIIQSRTTLLLSEKLSLLKKERDEEFDLPMGC